MKEKMVSDKLKHFKERMASDKLKHFIEDLKQLPTISSTTVRITEIAEKEDVDIQAITHLIMSDQALSSRVLRIANYALLETGREGDVKTVERAVNVLGMNRVLAIALSLVVINLFEAGWEGKAFNLVEFWRHSSACAIASELLARRFSYPQPEEAFIAGLLHDMGRLILFRWKGDQYDKIVAEARATKTRLLDIEEKHLGIGHTQAAKVLMERWKFPSSLVESAWLHHQPMSEFQTNRREQLPFIIKCADSLCHIQRFGDSGNPISDLDAGQLELVTELSADDVAQLSTKTLNGFEDVARCYDWK